MKNDKRPLSLWGRFDEWLRAMPKSERAKIKGLKQLEIAVETASELLFWSKFAPQVEDPAFHAKWASHDLKASKRIILKAAETNDKRFFIALGKCLSGEMDPGMHDKMDECVALILACNPWIPARQGVRALEKLGCPRITEDNFRMRKQRLKCAVGNFGLYIPARKQRSKRKRSPRH